LRCKSTLTHTLCERLQWAVREVLTQYVEAEEGRLVNLELERRKADLLVVATVHATQPLNQETVEDLEALLSGHLDHLVQLEMIVLPVIRAGER
jgi:F0F1-type ATP synthase delta subunit